MRTLGACVICALISGPAAAQTLTTFARNDYGGAAGTRAIVTADFNRDGWLDLATVGVRGSLRVLLSNGRAGGFRRLPEVTLGGGPFELAAGDLNRDGVPDLVVANADANAVDFLIGTGDGTFTHIGQIDIAGGSPRGIALADCDRDGSVDVIVTEYATGAFRILFGDGNGSIRRSVRIGAIANPQGVVAADFNRDGRVDIALASAGVNAVAIFYSTGNDGFVQRNVTVGAVVNVVAAADIDNDGWPDLAAASSSNSKVYTLLGHASGLTWTGTVTTGASPRGIALVDVNQDGRVDLITGNRAANSVSVHFGHFAPLGTFDLPLTFAVGGGGRAVAAGDFDHDGAIDLATANEFGNSTSVLTNTTAFAAPAFRFTLFQFGGSESGGGGATVLGDFDRDGHPDIAANLNGLAVWLTSRGRVQIDSADHSPGHIAVGDLNGDGALDLVTIDIFSGSTSVRAYINHGNGTFTAAAPMSLNIDVRDLAVADFNRDGRADIVILGINRSTNEGVLRVALGLGDGTFTTAANSDTVVPFAQRIVVADVNRDGRFDVVVGSTGGNVQGLSVWLGRGDGTAARVEFYDLPRASTDIALADLDEDGLLDLIATDFGRGLQIRLALPAGGFGPVTFQLAVTTDATVTVLVESIRVADINLDGHLDVITDNLDILFGRGDATFTLDRLSTFAAPGFEQVAIADVNGDGLPDLVFADTLFNLAVNDRSHVNHPPTVSAGPDRTENFMTLLDTDTVIASEGSDPDMHELEYVWRDADGKVVFNGQFFWPGGLPPSRLSPGPHTFTVTASDGRGGEASDSMVLTIAPFEEIYIHPSFEPNGAWRFDDDPRSPFGRRLHHPDAGAPKLQTPLANPVNYFEVIFPADPSQSYKLWLRLKADGDFWGNDSVFVQFEDGVDASGRPLAPIGSTAALAVNLEECSGCGLSGWGWEDDGWGAKDRTTATVVRFPTGRGRIRVQTREDGVSVDQIVLSAKRFLTTRPGAAKKDSLILPSTVPE